MANDRERAFQRKVKAAAEKIGIHAENVHPGIGMNPGFPDMVFSIDGLLFPVELKLLKQKDDMFRVSNIRAAQFSWLNRCYNRGDLCGLVADLGSSSMAVPILDLLGGKRWFDGGELQLDPVESVLDALEMAKKWRKKGRS